MFTLQNLKQRGFDFLVREYVNMSSASERYLQYLDIEMKKALLLSLGLSLTESVKVQQQKENYQSKYEQVFKTKRTNK